MTVRLGIERPDRPPAVVAEAEARVIEHELARRLGDVTVDLRVDGEPVGRWLPVAHAAWPADVDGVAATATLWDTDLPPLTALFARTIEPVAAEVRTRMLRHLGMIPTSPFTLDDALVARLVAQSIRPTDLWIIARSAETVATDDRAIEALAGRSGDGSDRLDGAFDRLVASLDVDRGPAIARLTAERDDALRRVGELADDLARDRVELADRLDSLAAENAVLRERLERAELDRSLAP